MCGCLNELKYNVEIDIINLCDIIEAPKVRNINKGIKFCCKGRIIYLNRLFNDSRRYFI